MADRQKLRQVIERIVAEKLEAHVSALTSEIVESASHELGVLLAQSAAPGAGDAAPVNANAAGVMPTDILNAAFASVMDSNSQSDILQSLLDGSVKFSQRSALFVMKGGSAIGWRGRGFDDNDAIKTIRFDPTEGLAGRAYASHHPAQAAAAEFNAEFISIVGEPLTGSNAIVLPLLLHNKVAALLYADGGSIGEMDPSALECLTRGASLWLEIVSARKSGATAPAAETVAEPETPPTEKIAAVAEPEAPPAPAVEVPVQAAAAAAPAPITSSFEDEEVHKKAKRFAKLLVDEIKLYNKQKVADGCANKDLYHRLKDDIDKSRATYEKRYGQSAAGSAKYFDEELVRILCDGDASLLGA